MAGGRPWQSGKRFPKSRFLSSLWPSINLYDESKLEERRAKKLARKIKPPAPVDVKAPAEENTENVLDEKDGRFYEKDAGQFYGTDHKQAA